MVSWLARPLQPSFPSRLSSLSKLNTCLADILNYALTLEHLEDNFYREGLSKYSEEHFTEAGCDNTFYENLKKVSQDESDHVAFLTEALSGKSTSLLSTANIPRTPS